MNTFVAKQNYIYNIRLNVSISNFIIQESVSFAKSITNLSDNDVDLSDLMLSCKNIMTSSQKIMSSCQIIMSTLNMIMSTCRILMSTYQKVLCHLDATNWA